MTRILSVLASALVLLPWERIPRYLHAVSPIGGLAVAFALEVQFGLSIVRAFPFVLLPLIFLALYYTSIEFAVGAALAGSREVWDAVDRESQALAGKGRVLVRASGTEPLVRVMVEAPEKAHCEEIAGRLAATVERQLA